MAVISAVFVPNQVGGVSAALATTASSAAILIGKRQLFRIWVDKGAAGNAGGPLNILFGGAAVAAPAATDYAIGEVPQDFYTGDAFTHIRLTNSNAATESYHILPLNKF